MVRPLLCKKHFACLNPSLRNTLLRVVFHSLPSGRTALLTLALSLLTFLNIPQVIVTHAVVGALFDCADHEVQLLTSYFPNASSESAFQCGCHVLVSDDPYYSMIETNLLLQIGSPRCWSPDSCYDLERRPRYHTITHLLPSFLRDGPTLRAI